MKKNGSVLSVYTQVKSGYNTIIAAFLDKQRMMRNI